MAFDPSEARDSQGRWTQGQRQLSRLGAPKALVRRVTARVYRERSDRGATLHAGRENMAPALRQGYFYRGRLAKRPVIGLYTTSGRLAMDGERLVIEHVKATPGQLRDAAIHEAAHGLDTKASSSPDFKRAYVRDLVRRFKTARPSPFLTTGGDYWASSPREAFAEASLARLDPSGPHAKRMQARAPYIMRQVARTLVGLGMKVRKDAPASE